MRKIREKLFLFIIAVCSFSCTQSIDLIDFVISSEQERVLQTAHCYLKEFPVTITAFESPRSAGGKHDYFSEGDYWWPDPENPEGPYVRKDGQSNPDNFDWHRKALIRLSLHVPALTSAFILTNDSIYAAKALEHLRAWFINESTRMNPHLTYAQAIHGRVTGRGVGIIDTIHLIEVVQSVKILYDIKAIPEEDFQAVQQWFDEYLQWMTTHDYGIDERDRINNHGSCWVLQVAVFAELTENDSLINDARERFKKFLLPNQLAEDGSFPLELARTKPYSYSLFNMEILGAIAHILSTPQENLWEYTLHNGASLRTAVDFIIPYIRNK
ncbi:MAG: alginate lyase family protein, partial [Candidatus Marinimicrobia bacterium]|nr:alginate lyase family protein [Candidatus Neomarinimicrobiota bacterium]